MEGSLRESGISRKPSVDVSVDGKTYVAFEQGNDAYSVVDAGGRSFMTEPGESAEDLIKRALKMGVELKEKE